MLILGCCLSLLITIPGYAPVLNPIQVFGQLVPQKQLHKRYTLFWFLVVIASAWKHVHPGYVPGLTNLSKLIVCVHLKRLY